MDASNNRFYREKPKAVLGHAEIADRICKTEGMTFALAASSGKEGDLREARKYLHTAIASALQEAFDCGFRAAGGSIAALKSRET